MVPKKAYVDALLGSIEADFEMAVVDLPYGTKRQIHIVDSLVKDHREKVEALRRVLKELY